MTEPAVRRRALFLMLAAAIFVALTIVAMVVYRGGSIFDLGARHYLFFGNFFSDLGATVTYSGRANALSRALFVVALTSVGVAFVWSAPVWRAWALRDEALGAATIARVVAVLSGLGFIGIAVTPPNSERGVHIALVQTAFTLLLVFVAVLVVVQLCNDVPRVWLGVNLGLVALLAVYVALVVVGPNLDTVAGVRIQIVAQKIIVYASIFDLSFQAWGLVRRAGVPRSLPSRSRGGPQVS